jgi:hypothetical protein
VAIDKFTANPNSNSDPLLPIEREDQWPTFENIVSCFERITATAKSGDCVYIHFSGHGTKLNTISTDSRDQTKSDFAIVLFDKIQGVRYLPGLQLAQIINQMVEKGVLVTLVLDCCFSGKIARHGQEANSNIRYIDHDPVIEAAYPSSVSEKANDNLDSSHLRGARRVPRWLIDPKGYTILTACGPHEIAEELIFDGGTRSGALSHFLLRALITLRNSGVNVTHQSLYQHIGIRFHASWPIQNPMRYGNKNFSLFGKVKSQSYIPFFPVFRRQKDD